MTLDEAQALVHTLWAPRGVWSVVTRADGGADIHMHPGEASYVRHQLNAQGQPVCHEECQALASKSREKEPEPERKKRR